MDDALMAWLGPAADQLTNDQLELVEEADRDIQQRYPDPDDGPDREAALTATVQFVLGETDAEQAKRKLIEARRREREAYVAAVQVAVMMVRHDGSKKATAAKAVGVARRGFLEALGDIP